jgi:NAD(P)-dependent dehydrogenase (short-subunit alcohol dehydrogenase family)
MSQTQTGQERRPWTALDVGSQQGRTVVVTGANSGIGFEAALVLAQRGAVTVLACRDAGRGNAAAARITAAAPGSAPEVVELDLGSLASVAGAVAQVSGRHERVDLLINNAGVMMPPFATTADGFELQFGVNHLGHFALTGLLLPLMLAVPGSRVVTVSSNGHRMGRVNFADLQSQRSYRRMRAYNQSKLANLLFTCELQRRLAAAGAATAALAAHPGTASTGLVRHLPLPALSRAAGGLIGHSAAMGALPVLRAATDPAARGGDYYGPGGWLQMQGCPRLVRPAARALDEQAQRRLWQESEQLTGITFPV